MKHKDILWCLVEAVLWYAFIYFGLYVIKTDGVNLYQAAFILLVLCYLAVLACPWVRHTDSWQKMMGKKQ